MSLKWIMTNKEKWQERRLNKTFKKKYGCQKKKPKKGKYQKLRESKKYLDFKRFVRRRDDNQCQYCGYRPLDPMELVVHHLGMVKDEPKNACDPNNAVLICITCHTEIHPWLRKKTPV